MIAQKATIEEYIPQRNPIIMIDSLVSCEGATTVSELEIRADNLFVQDDKLQLPGLVENIAQTAAARAGYLARQQQQAAPVGYIGALKNLVLHTLPKVGETIRTEVKVTNEVFGVTIIEGKSYSEELLLAETEMKIFIETAGN
jgi:predicted hotdog family 3-hydroxylacyl-ACP dehydratase